MTHILITGSGAAINASIAHIIKNDLITPILLVDVDPLPRLGRERRFMEGIIDFDSVSISIDGISIRPYHIHSYQNQMLVNKKPHGYWRKFEKQSKKRNLKNDR